MIFTAIVSSLFFFYLTMGDNNNVEYMRSKLRIEIRAEMSGMVNKEMASMRQELQKLHRRIHVQEAQINDKDNIPRNRARSRKSEQVTCKTSIDGNDFVFNGCNIHIRNGAGMTAKTNSLGNLIIGYNEDSTQGKVRTGSHSLVIGPKHTYTHYGGLIVGDNNSITARYASVIGGTNNLATEKYALVSGGRKNEASGVSSVASGGTDNKADGKYSAISGGEKIKVRGVYSYSHGILSTESGTE